MSTSCHLPQYGVHMDEREVAELVQNVHDWQYQHGSLIKNPPHFGEVLARPIGATLIPTIYPESIYTHVQELQVVYNRLYAAISEDEDFLEDTLSGLMKDETSMARILWDIHCAVKKEGYLQSVSLGIFRSDYMLHVEESQSNAPLVVSPKQVEFNTFSVAGGAHGNRIADMHRYGTDFRK